MNSSGGKSDQSGIFIVGAPRSGTTLLRLMLDSHRALAIPPETHFLKDIFEVNQSRRITAQLMLSLIVRSRRWNDFGIDKDTLGDLLHSCSPFSLAGGIEAFYSLYASRFGKPRWGDKTPEYGHIVNRIMDDIPESKIIHIIRDGRDVYLSLRSTWFSQGWNVRNHANYWKDYVSFVDQHRSDHGRYLSIRYEDLVLNPSVTLKKVCSFANLDYSEELLSYYRDTPKRLGELKDYYTPSGRLIRRDKRLLIHKLAFGPPQASRVRRWYNEMTHDEIALYLSVAGESLAEHGYEIG